MYGLCSSQKPTSFKWRWVSLWGIANTLTEGFHPLSECTGCYKKVKWEKYIIDNLDILFSKSLPAELWLSSLGGLSIYHLDIVIPVFYTSFMILYDPYMYTIHSIYSVKDLHYHTFWDRILVTDCHIRNDDAWCTALRVMWTGLFVSPEVVLVQGPPGTLRCGWARFCLAARNICLVESLLERIYILQHYRGILREIGDRSFVWRCNGWP